MTTMPPSYTTLLEWLTEALNNRDLPVSISAPMLPDLAKSLERITHRYVTDENELPTFKLFVTITNNYLQDGVRVETLLATCKHDEQGYWAALRNTLLAQTAKQCSQLSQADQEEIAIEVWKRILRYLPDFSYRSRFSTWVATILRNRVVTWWARNRSRIENEVSIDTLTEIDASLDDPIQEVEQNQLRDELWQRLEELGRQEGVELAVRVLRMLYVEGYKQTEIAELLQLSNAKVTRHKQRMLESIAQDERFRSIARELHSTS